MRESEDTQIRTMMDLADSLATIIKKVGPVPAHAGDRRNILSQPRIRHPIAEEISGTAVIVFVPR